MLAPHARSENGLELAVLPAPKARSEGSQGRARSALPLVSLRLKVRPERPTELAG